ncbi:MAG: DUF6049 family protein [Acidimicrobiales bacterium]
MTSAHPGRWLLASVAVLAATLLQLAAQAQSTGRSTLRLASQTPWVGPGQEFALRLDIETAQPRPDVEVVVAVYRAVRNRTEFARTLDTRPAGVPLTVTPPTPLSELEPDPTGAYHVRLPVQDPALPRDPAQLRLDDQGVYPVRVELRGVGGGAPLASLVTHLIYATPPAEGGSPLKVGLILPVHAGPALQPDGTRQLTAEASERLGVLARSLAAPSGVPLTLMPTPETLEALESGGRPADRETLAALAEAAKGRQVVAATYVPVALPALAEAGLASEVAAQLDRGNEVIERTLGTRPDARTWVGDGPLDQRTVQQLRAQQVDRLVIPEADLEPIPLDRTLSQPFEFDVPAVRRPEVLAGDRGLAAHFASTDDQVLAAHHLLADLAVVYRDLPSRNRAVVAMVARSWRPTAAFLDTVINGLKASPVLQAATVGDIFDGVEPAKTGRAPLVRRLAPLGSSRALPAPGIRAARAALQAFGSMLKAENRLDDDIEAVLLVAEGTDLKASRQRAYLGGVTRSINAQTGLIEVPDNRSVTLTARRGEIPVTVLSRAAYPVVLRLEVASEKLAFPDGSSRPIELTRKNTTERFPVRARASGAFALRLRLTTPDGAMVLGTSRFTVRSTAASGVGVVLSAGAGAFLVVWWGRHLVRGRRGRRNRHLIPA